MTKQILYLGLDSKNFKTDGYITHYPIIRIHPCSINDSSIQQAFQSFSAYTHVIITSKSTLPILLQNLVHFNYSLQDWMNKKTIAVGQITAHHLKEQGIQPFLIAKEETAEGITQELETLALQNTHFFWPHSSRARSIIPDFFQKKGWKLTRCALYDTFPYCSDDLIDLSHFDEIVFTSPSTVDAFLHFFKKFPKTCLLTSIGPITKNYLNLKISHCCS